MWLNYKLNAREATQSELVCSAFYVYFQEVRLARHNIVVTNCYRRL